MSSGEKQSEKERYSRDKHDRERRRSRSRSRTPPRRRSHGKLTNCIGTVMGGMSETLTFNYYRV